MKTRKIPLRKCIGCNQQFNKKDMIRIVKNKENEFSIDLTGKANGRGAYICKSIECFNKAKKKDSFSRVFDMKMPEKIYEELKKELTGNER